MAILSDDQILEVLNKPKNPMIKDWQDHHNIMSVYCNGGNVADLLEKVKSYENNKQYQLRKDIARSTKDKIIQLIKPIHKIFSANGGSVKIEETTETKKKLIEDLLSELPDGKSLNQWVEEYLVPANLHDQNSIVLVELGKEEDGTEGKAYPTYKSISIVHDYIEKWGKIEYLILKHKKVKINGNDVQVYRVYDDEKDALYYINENADTKTLGKYGNSILLGQDGFDEEHLVENLINEVPALVAGVVTNNLKKENLSLLNNIEENLKEYLRASSVFIIYKFLHLFPRFWSYAMKCVTCKGEGQIVSKTKKDEQGNPIKVVCPTCDGARLKVNTDVSDVISLPAPTNGQPVIGGNFAGYIDTPDTAWKQMTEDLTQQVKEMENALWGTYLSKNDNDSEKTATEVYIDTQPVNEMLHRLSGLFEKKQSKIATYIAKLVSLDTKASVTVLNGKRFIIENTDSIWNKYLKAKENQAPITTLDALYDEYLQSLYQNNIDMFNIEKKKFCVEPMGHYSLDDLKSLSSNEILLKKVVFSQWLTTEIDWTKEIEQLKSEFETYYKSNIPVVENTTQKQTPGGQEA